jgi:hypothetical protein
MIKKLIDIFLSCVVAFDTQAEQADHASRRRHAARLSAAWDRYFFD